MPTPNENEPREEFISRCIPIVINDGTAETPEQAYAVCVSMYNEGKMQEFLTRLNDAIGNIEINKR